MYQCRADVGFYPIICLGEYHLDKCLEIGTHQFKVVSIRLGHLKFYLFQYANNG